jgi:hypothetical protein
MPEAVHRLEEGRSQENHDQGHNLTPGLHGPHQTKEEDHRGPGQKNFLDRGVAVQGKGDQGSQTIAVPQGPDLKGPGGKPPHHSLGQRQKLKKSQKSCSQHQAPEGRAGESARGVPGQEGGQAYSHQEDNTHQGEGEAQGGPGPGMDGAVSQRRQNQDRAADGQDQVAGGQGCRQEEKAGRFPVRGGLRAGFLGLYMVCQKFILSIPSPPSGGRGSG